MSQIKFTLRCPKCANTKFKAQSGTATPSSVVVCSACGATVDLAAEKERLAQEARAAVEVRLRDVT